MRAHGNKGIVRALPFTAAGLDGLSCDSCATPGPLIRAPRIQNNRPFRFQPFPAAYIIEKMSYTGDVMTM